MFFHSGGRLTELVKLKAGDVDLERQRYKAVILKGANRKEVYRTIKNIAVPYWQYFLQGTENTDYLFSRGLKPGSKHQTSDNISRLWKRLVKEGLGLDVSLYTLKHVNTTEVVELLDNRAAAKLNSHESTKMVDTVYDVNRGDREHEKLKKVDNKFA